MAANDQGKAEDFKRATASALRAIARTADVQVAYQPGPSGLAGKRARLPAPSRALPAAEMAKLRGMADAMALRLRHHDDALHTARAPASREAKEAYDALEQARVEIVGAAHMEGVSANLRGRLNEECETEGLSRMTRRDQLPLPTALVAAGARPHGPGLGAGRGAAHPLALAPYAEPGGRGGADRARRRARRPVALYQGLAQAAGGLGHGRSRGRDRGRRRIRR